MSYTPPGAPPPPPPGGYGYGPPGYPQGGYGAPGYGAPVVQQSNGMAVAALVIGILSAVTGCLSPLGIVAVVLGFVGLSKAKKIGGKGKGLAIGGIITGIIGLIVAVVLAVTVVWAANEVDSDPSDGVCNPDRVIQDPDCGVGVDSDPSDGTCDPERFTQDPDC